MTSIPPLVICSILAPLLAYILLQYAWRRVIRYRIMPFHVGVSIFGLTVCKTAVTDILEARKVLFRELLPWNNSKSIGWCRLGNRFYGDGISPDELSEVSLQATSAELRRIARFLDQCAASMETHPNFGHAHLKDTDEAMKAGPDVIVIQ